MIGIAIGNGALIPMCISNLKNANIGNGEGERLEFQSISNVFSKAFPISNAVYKLYKACTVGKT